MTRPFTLTPDQRETFERRGVLRLPGFYDPALIAPMADAIWADMMVRLGVIRDRPGTWTVVRPAHFQTLTSRRVFDPLGTAEARRLADALLGAGGWAEPPSWAQPLVTLPSAQPDLPGPAWHFDLPGDDYRLPLPGLRLFTILEPVRPGGGGTLVIAGSHRLALDIAATDGPIRSAQMRKTLGARHPWLAELMDASMGAACGRIDDAAQLGDVEVEVEQMTGEPGDVIVMHPLMLHGVAHNASPHPRLMATTWVWRKG